MTIYNIKVLTKNYKYNISYLYILFVFSKKLYRLQIPYWIRRSNITDNLIRSIDNAIKFLNRK